MAREEFEDLEGLEDSYDQIQKMAIGGMAEVFRARQRHLDRPVAIKRMREELRSNKDLKERFRREAKAAANLVHQNICHVYDFVTHKNDSFIILEWIDGFDLAQVLEKSGPLPLDIAAIIAVKMLRGLQYIHSHGMVHRDLKPDNIRLSLRGEVKIMDFGIAFDPSEQNLTIPGMLMGSPHYLSPEQVLGAKLDSRSDLFSFGITFYEMLTGKRPFYETQTESVYTRIQKAEYIKPRLHRSDLPPFFEKIIENCLQLKAEKRPAQAAQMESVLMEYLARNYSLAFEARLRKFLLDAKFIKGNAALIEIDDPTQARFQFEFFQGVGARVDHVLDRLADAISLKVLSGFIVTSALLLMAHGFYKRHSSQVESVVPKIEEATKSQQAASPPEPMKPIQIPAPPAKPEKKSKKKRYH
jgi:serine/threonine protein kinase